MPRSLDEYRDDAGQEVNDSPVVTATPFAWPDPTTIPPRDWIYGRWILRGELTSVIAPGGVGKSSLLTAIAMSMSSGREILGKTVWNGPKNVWCWNLEDDAVELDRQISANSLRHGISQADCKGSLYIDSGLDQRLCTALETADGLTIIEPVYDAVLAEIKNRKIDVLIIDPFVSSHEVAENDNNKIDKIAKRWKAAANAGGCAIVLAHHSRKTNGTETTTEDSRGASSLGDATRISLALNKMTTKEAKKFGIVELSVQASLFRVDTGKSSRAPAESAQWFKIESTGLGNATDEQPADQVGAVTNWKVPDPFEDVTVANLKDVQIMVSTGNYRKDAQAKEWVGRAVADVLGLDLENPAEKEKVKTILKTWFANGKLADDLRPDDNRKEKVFVSVGEPAL